MKWVSLSACGPGSDVHGSHVPSSPHEGTTIGVTGVNGVNCVNGVSGVNVVNVVNGVNGRPSPLSLTVYRVHADSMDKLFPSLPLRNMYDKQTVRVTICGH